MRIVICGSLKFYDEMLKVKDNLEKRGFEVILPMKIVGTNYDNKSVEDGKRNIRKHDAINKHYKNIVASDSILVMNLDKNGVKNYIGGNSFLEMGFAYVNGKKIFVLNELPEDLNYCEEMHGMEPVIIKRNLSIIK